LILALITNLAPRQENADFTLSSDRPFVSVNRKTLFKIRAACEFFTFQREFSHSTKISRLSNRIVRLQRFDHINTVAKRALRAASLRILVARARTLKSAGNIRHSTMSAARLVYPQKRAEGAKEN
jgi:hypothetical protein